jgi:hypothetical protein
MMDGNTKEFDIEKLTAFRKTFPRPIHTLYVAASLYDELFGLFNSGHQLGLGSIRIIPSVFLPGNVAVGLRGSENEIVIITT